MSKKPITYDKIPLDGCSALSLLNTIKEAIATYGEDNVFFDLFTEGWEDSKYATAELSCTREMTPEEIKAHKDREKANQEAIERNERAAFEKLKAKYGNPKV
jgi:hypothetical protein